MDSALVFLGSFSDLAYDVSRFLLRFASVLFLAHVLTFILVAVLTWRPSARRRELERERPRASAVTRRRFRPSLLMHRPLPHRVSTSTSETRREPVDTTAITSAEGGPA